MRVLVTSHPHQHFSVVSVLDSGHSHRSIVIAHCCFKLQFLKVVEYVSVCVFPEVQALSQLHTIMFLIEKVNDVRNYTCLEDLKAPFGPDDVCSISGRLN